MRPDADRTSVGETPTSGRHRRAVRNVVRSLHQAVQAARQRPRGHRLRLAASNRFVTAASTLLAEGDLELHFHGGTVSVPAGEVWTEVDGNDLVQELWQLGVGGMHLRAGTAAATLRTLVDVLAESRLDAGGIDDDVVTALRTAGADDVHLLPIESGAPEAPLLPTGLSAWTQLPLCLRSAPAFTPAFEREAALNLPALVARVLLQDLETAPDDAAAACIGPLLGGMLERGDAKGAANLLEQGLHHAHVTPGTCVALRALADEHLRGGALIDQLANASADDLMGLLALAMQLGDGAVQHLLAQATAAGVPVPPWILDTI
jgi:hypothetical protein